jgi:hypothetical protein
MSKRVQRERATLTVITGGWGGGWTRIIRQHENGGPLLITVYSLYSYTILLSVDAHNNTKFGLFLGRRFVAFPLKLQIFFGLLFLLEFMQTRAGWVGCFLSRGLSLYT